MNVLSKHTLNAPIGSLDAYIHQINQIPMLTADEEYAYAAGFQKNGDLESAKRLILPHLRYVVRLARGYLGYGLALADLIQEGNVGLMKAVKRFDPTVGVRLASFAVHWIRAEIHEFVIKNWRIVKIATTKAQRKLFFNLRQMKKRLGWLSVEEMAEVAKDLGVTTKDVIAMEQRLNAMDVSFCTQTEDEDNGESAWVPSKYLADPEVDPALMFEHKETQVRNTEGLERALRLLDDRSRDILYQRWLIEDKAVTLQALADQYEVSVERIRQLEKNALKKLKQLMDAS